MPDRRAQAALWRIAGRLAARRKGRKPRPPALFFLTDPNRTPDPVAAAVRLPRGTTVVFRAFGAADAVHVGLRLAALCRGRGLRLLVGADAGLAAAVGADGVHLPERLLGTAGRLRRRRPAWTLTAAAHGPAAVRRARLAGVDAVLLSPVFPSRSTSAGRPLGPLRAAAMARLAAPTPVIALGGVGPRSAGRLMGAGIAGLAAVDALAVADAR